ncbi:MAG: M23 family metallopeptidase [Cyanobacteriota bacterium]|nr:M23 family metallopeptidase [Cyanobacteriota bacterium]
MSQSAIFREAIVWFSCFAMSSIPMTAQAVESSAPGFEEIPITLMDRSTGMKIIITSDDRIQIEDPLAVIAPVPTQPIPMTSEKPRFPLPKSAPITSAVGIRTDPFTGQPRVHQGLDLGAPQGTPVLAAMSGQVILAGDNGNLGIAAVIAHAGDRRTRYGHMSEVVVASGQTVTQGEVIGYVGSTGRSTGPHLHFELWQRSSGSNWTVVDGSTLIR